MIMDSKLIPIQGGFSLLPAAVGTCPLCATKHHPEQPHNQQSLFFQMRFHGLHGRWPTWADAIAHCDDDMRRVWTKALNDRAAWSEPADGVVISEPASTGGVQCEQP